MAKAAAKTQASTPAPAPDARPAASVVFGGKVEKVPLEVKGTTIEFPVRKGAQGDSYFCLGVRKSGSTMLHRVMNFLANRNQVNVVDVPSTFFRNGFTVADWQALDLDPLLAPGNCYLGFRTFPDNLITNAAFRDGLKVFMFRDPRDALVSQYFSDAYSHDIPKGDTAGEGRELFLKKREEAQQADIDAWVLDKVGGIRKTMLSYKDMLSDPKCLIVRYEDYVFQKRRMIMKILHHFGWTVEIGRINKLLAEIDVVPDAEDKSRFVRKVIPGDHNAKLKNETVRRLNKKLEEVMTLYDYY